MTSTTSAVALPTFTRQLAASNLWVKVGAVLAGSILIAASARVTVPMYPVPMTMQTFTLLVIGALYGSRLGFATVLAYLAEGAMGLPVFASGGGVHHFFGPTAGFLIGFPFVALLAGLATERGLAGNPLTAFLSFSVAHAAAFAVGVPVLAGMIGWDKAIAAGLMPFLVGSVVKTALAVATWEAAGRLGGRA